MWAISLVMVLATGVVPKGAAQTNAPASTSALSPEDAFRKGGEAYQRKDFAQAVALARQAANQGHVGAQGMLGAIYLSGEGVKQDYPQGLFWIRKAAEQGDASWQAILGGIYLNSEYGVKQDYAQALLWNRKAAEQGDASAQAVLGAMYLNGEGVKQDNAQALLWLSKSAEQGSAEAQRNLGYMYANGKGVTADLGKAIEWTQRAAAQGHVAAQKNLEILQHLMRGPSDEEVLQLVKDRLRLDAIESIKAEYAGVDKVTTDNPFSIFEAKSKAAVSMSLACSLNAPKDRQPCLNKMQAELLAERAASIQRIKNIDFGTEFISTVEDKKNYEGNYVALVNIRQRGADKAFRWKLLLKFANGAWAIAEKSENEIR